MTTPRGPQTKGIAPAKSPQIKGTLLKDTPAMQARRAAQAAAVAATAARAKSIAAANAAKNTKTIAAKQTAAKAKQAHQQAVIKANNARKAAAAAAKGQAAAKKAAAAKQAPKPKKAAAAKTGPGTGPVGTPAQAAAGWDEALHPRGAAGGPTGGMFIAAGSGGGAAPPGEMDQVKGAQAALGLPVTGQMTPADVEAVKAFQQKNGLQVDGVIGAQTAAGLRGKVNDGDMSEAHNTAPGALTEDNKGFLARNGKQTGMSSRFRDPRAAVTERFDMTTPINPPSNDIGDTALVDISPTPDIDADPDQLASAVDAVLDAVTDQLAGVDPTTLPPSLQQALALIVAADTTVDKLLEVMQIPDPDEAADLADLEPAVDEATPPDLTGYTTLFRGLAAYRVSNKAYALGDVTGQPEPIAPALAPKVAAPAAVNSDPEKLAGQVVAKLNQLAAEIPASSQELDTTRGIATQIADALGNGDQDGAADYADGLQEALVAVSLDDLDPEQTTELSAVGDLIDELVTALQPADAEDPDEPDDSGAPDAAPAAPGGKPFTNIERQLGFDAVGPGEDKAAPLKKWFNEGADGAIHWGVPGDFEECVVVASKHMDPQKAKGFCNERHMDTNGGQAAGVDAHGGKMSAEDTEFADTSAAGRRKAASSGAAMKDGSFPISSASDIPKAVSSLGRTDEAKRPAIKAHIKRRARSLGATHLIPDSWKASNASKAWTVTADGAPAAEAVAEAPGEIEISGNTFTLPIGILEGVTTGDKRKISPQALSWREHVPVMAIMKTTKEHQEAELVGKMTSLERFDASAIPNPKTGEPYGEGVFGIRGKGEFTNLEYAQTVKGLVKDGFLKGVSADLSDVSQEFEADPGEEFGEEGDEIDLIGMLTGQGKSGTELVTEGRIMGFTICPFPAFEGAYLEIDSDDGPVSTPQEAQLAASGTEIERWPAFEIKDEFGVRICVPCQDGSLVASAGAGPMYPPKEWFSDPGLTEVTPLTITEDGRVFGHLAPWNQCHTGVSGTCVIAPRSRMDYGLFHKGALKTASGEVISTGVITMDTGHASEAFSLQPAMSHYDDSGSQAADVCMGEDRHGIWFSGAIRPDVDELKLRRLRASGLSGDWRAYGGNLELMAALAVNVEGFPKTRSRVASGAIQALTAAGGREVIRHALSRKSTEELIEQAVEPRLDTTFTDQWVNKLVSERVTGLRASVVTPHLQSLRASVVSPAMEARAAELRGQVVRPKASEVLRDLRVRSLRASMGFDNEANSVIRLGLWDKNKHPRAEDGKFGPGDHVEIHAPGHINHGVKGTVTGMFGSHAIIKPDANQRVEPGTKDGDGNIKHRISGLRQPALTAAGYDESKHLRGKDGKWIHFGDNVSVKGKDGKVTGIDEQGNVQVTLKGGEKQSVKPKEISRTPTGFEGKSDAEVKKASQNGPGPAKAAAAHNELQRRSNDNVADAVTGNPPAVDSTPNDGPPGPGTADRVWPHIPPKSAPKAEEPVATPNTPAGALNIGQTVSHPTKGTGKVTGIDPFNPAGDKATVKWNDFVHKGTPTNGETEENTSDLTPAAPSNGSNVAPDGTPTTPTDGGGQISKADAAAKMYGKDSPQHVKAQKADNVARLKAANAAGKTAKTKSAGKGPFKPTPLARKVDSKIAAHKAAKATPAAPADAAPADAKSPVPAVHPHNVGDRVTHPTLGSGTVTGIDPYSPAGPRSEVKWDQPTPETGPTGRTSERPGDLTKVGSDANAPAAGDGALSGAGDHAIDDINYLVDEGDIDPPSSSADVADQVDPSWLNELAAEHGVDPADLMTHLDGRLANGEGQGGAIENGGPKPPNSNG